MFLCTCIRLSYMLGALAIFQMQQLDIAIINRYECCYGDFVYKLKKIVGSNNFSAQFIKIISHYKKIGYNINVLQQTACLVVNPITVGNFAFLFNCTLVGRTSDSMMVQT